MICQIGLSALSLFQLQDLLVEMTKQDSDNLSMIDPRSAIFVCNKWDQANFFLSIVRHFDNYIQFQLLIDHLVQLNGTNLKTMKVNIFSSALGNLGTAR